MPVDAPILETPRLILRGLDAERDLDAWAEFAADAETMRTIASKPLNRAEAWRVLAMVTGHWVIRGFGFFAVFEKESGRFVGRVGPWRPEGWLGDEIGWLIGRPYWGRGYAGEAAAACMDWVVDTLGWTRIIHVIEASNSKSVRVAEKVGSRKLEEGRTLALTGLDGKQVVVDVWGQMADDWRAKRTAGA